jgi:ubiquinone/menaquinone biosynthesis C-methylase UbiE
MYESTADSYAKMMDAEIHLPIYSEILGRLQDRIVNTPGTLIDTACGSGHMLAMYHERYDQDRLLLGVDLSPRMVSIASKRLEANAEIVIGDMRALSSVESGTAAVVLNFFAVHHLDLKGVRAALIEWHRVLRTGGHVLIAAWEGAGVIDYGDASDIVALRYTADELSSLMRTVGFTVDRCVVEPVEELPMDAVYLEGVKEE